MVNTWARNFVMVQIQIMYVGSYMDLPSKRSLLIDDVRIRMNEVKPSVFAVTTLQNFPLELNAYRRKTTRSSVTVQYRRSGRNRDRGSGIQVKDYNVKLVYYHRTLYTHTHTHNKCVIVIKWHVTRLHSGRCTSDRVFRKGETTGGGGINRAATVAHLLQAVFFFHFAFVPQPFRRSNNDLFDHKNQSAAAAVKAIDGP